MSVLAPIWLVGLLPWMAVVIWLLTGRRERTAVPFLDLWRGGDAPLPKAQAAMHVPPAAVLLMLAASLLAIVAASRPRVGMASNSSRRIMMLIDHRTNALEPVEREIADRFGDAPMERVILSSDEPIASAIRRGLSDPDSLILVMSDQTLSMSDPRLIQIVPEGRALNAGIAMAAASIAPRAQIMVRVRNDSSLTSAVLSAGAASETIELPVSGHEKNYFLDIDRMETKTQIKLAANDELPADNEVELTHAASWPQIEPEPGLPPEIGRVTEVYGKLRPPEKDSIRIAITMGAMNRPAIKVGRADRLIGATTIQTEDHPITSNVGWPAIAKEPLRIAAAPDSQWRIVARAGPEPILAIRETPVRQAWIGFSSESLPRSSDFVILWTNMLDWVGKGEERFVAVGTFAKPGNAPPPIDWRRKLDEIPPALRAGREISASLAGFSVLMIFAAALSWGVAKPAR